MESLKQSKAADMRYRCYHSFFAFIHYGVWCSRTPHDEQKVKEFVLSFSLSSMTEESGPDFMKHTNWHRWLNTGEWLGLGGDDRWFQTLMQ